MEPTLLPNIIIITLKQNYHNFQVVDMKEARIDTILASITKTLLVYLPERAVDPAIFYEENLVRRDEIGNTIKWV